MSNPNHLTRRNTLKRLGQTGLGLTLLSTPVVGDGSSDMPDGPSTNDATTPPGNGGGAVQTDANATEDTVYISGCKSYHSRVSLGVHYYGSVASPSTDEWFHEFCLSGASYAREEPLTCGDFEKNHAIDSQTVRAENNNFGDVFLTAQYPDPVYRGVTPPPTGSSTSRPSYSDTVRTVLETAIAYRFPAAAYVMTAEELATSVYNDLLRTDDGNESSQKAIENTWSYEGSSNPEYPPADAFNYFRFLVSSQNSYYIDVTAEQKIEGPPTNFAGGLSTSLRFSTDTDTNSLNSNSKPTLSKGMTTQEVLSTFPSKTMDPSSIPETSPIKNQVGNEKLVRVNLPITFEDPKPRNERVRKRQKS